MSNQELHDDIENIVTALKEIIPVLQSLGDDASNQIDRKINSSIKDIDEKISDLNSAIHRLKNTVQSNNLFFIEAENKALVQLKEGVKNLITTEVRREYSAQIAQVVANIEPLVASKINTEIEKLVEHKTLSISDHNEQVESINSNLKGNMTIIHKTLLESIEKLNTASAAANTRLDANLKKLKKITEAHQEKLQTVQTLTNTTATGMQKTLKGIERKSIFMSQSPAAMTAMTAGFLALCVMLSIVYVYDLWLPVVISAIALSALLGGIWGLVVWFDNRKN